MYKELKNQLEDKRTLEGQIQDLKDRIKYKIQKELGLHATTYSELKVECPTVDDRFSKVFAKIEDLDKRKTLLEGELAIIENGLIEINETLKKSSDKHKKVFKARFVDGLSVNQTAIKLNYSDKQIKRITAELFKK